MATANPLPGIASDPAQPGARLLVLWARCRQEQVEGVLAILPPASRRANCSSLPAKESQRNSFPALAYSRRA